MDPVSAYWLGFAVGGVCTLLGLVALGAVTAEEEDD